MPAREQFSALLREAVRGGTFIRLTLSKNTGGDSTLKTVTVRPVQLKGEAKLSFVYRHQTRDITKNESPADGIALIEENTAGAVFKNVHLQTADCDAQLLYSKKGAASFSVKKRENKMTACSAHDREKKRMIDSTRPFLFQLGVTNESGGVLPSMTRKWKQINAFLEIIDRAIKETDCNSAGGLQIADFGSGKGYLTFAVHDFLNRTLNIETAVTGIELRDELVDLCNGVAEKLNLQTIRFLRGDVKTCAPEKLDIMIALHACDIATDIAIHTGIRAGAEIILCAPCCHKEIRPQIIIPNEQKAVLQFGVHLGQEADMITDTLRALLLESAGYNAQIFEFISPEHTGKNKMILAVKRRTPSPAENLAALEQFNSLKNFYGIKTHHLETRLTDSSGNQ